MAHLKRNSELSHKTPNTLYVACTATSLCYSHIQQTFKLQCQDYLNLMRVENIPLTIMKTVLSHYLSNDTNKGNIKIKQVSLNSKRRTDRNGNND